MAIRLGRMAFRNQVRTWDINPASKLNYTAIDLPRNYYAGLKTSNDTDTDHDILIAVGQCRDATDTVNILHTLSGGISKRIDATWAAGHGNGGLNATDFASGSSGVEASTWYHVYLIHDGNLQSPTIDAGFDKSTTAANLRSDSGYTYYRRVASIRSDATAAPNANILLYTQRGNMFIPAVPQINGLLAPVTNVVETTTLNGAPLGFENLIHLNVAIRNNNQNIDGWVYDASQTDAASGIDADGATSPFANIMTQGSTFATQSAAQITVRTNTSAQIKHEFQCVGNVSELNYAVVSWIDDLGQYD